MTIFIQMFRFAAEPFFFSQKKDSDRNLILADVTKYFIIYGLIIFLGIMSYIDFLKYFVGPPKYWKGLSIVPVYLFANLCLGIYFNLTFWFKFSGKTYYGILITGLGALFTIVFNIILIPHYSYFGCSAIRLLSYIGMILFAYYLGRNQLEVKYDFRNIFLYITIALILFGVTYYFRFGNIIVNVVKNTIVLLLFIVFLERREHIISIFLKR
jgi:O-antigen/teichoic acid export membrane protein